MFRPTAMKVFITLIILFSTGWLSGCGEVYVSGHVDHALGWNVYVESNPSSHHHFDAPNRLIFSVIWYADHHDAHLDTFLESPHQGWVQDDGLEIDGCFFLGSFSHDEVHHESVIECLNPLYGVFDVHIHNPHPWRVPFTIEIKNFSETPFDTTQEVFTLDETLYGYDTMVIPFEY